MNEFPSITEDLPEGAFAHTRHMNRAFIVESLVLVVFIAVSIAFLIQMFVAAGVSSSNAHKLDMSARLSTDTAESFSAAPHAGTWTAYYDAEGHAIQSGTVDDGQIAWTVTTNGSAEKQTSGTLYHADITVTAHDGSTYDLSTERYVSSAKGGTA